MCSAKREGGTHVLMPPNRLIDVSGRILIQLFIMPKDNDSHFHAAQHAQLVRLLEEPAFALEESPNKI